MLQLSFIEETKEEKLEKEVARLRDQCEKIRKGQYAKLSALTKTVMELDARLSLYDRYVCQDSLLRK